MAFIVEQMFSMEYRFYNSKLNKVNGIPHLREFFMLY